MIINPDYLIKNEIITFPDTIDIIKHKQQNGIDIDCLSLVELTGTLVISEVAKTAIKGKKVHLYDNHWNLKKGHAYEFVSSFEIEVPNKMGGSLIGRSTFNRSGILIRSSWFDSGFHGVIGGTIYCFNDVVLTQGTRVGQFIMHETQEGSLYKGQYQKT